MAYENLGTPSGNNLYITIPLRGTQNWDEKLKDGFFQKVVDHDHTPGKGARIVEAALDVAVRSKLDQVAINTSEIAQNALDISQNAANILQNGLDIASNDNDIATNASEIAQNALDISQNAANILQNATDIASNDNDIASLDNRLTTTESNINTDITGLNNRLTTAESNISSNDTDIAGLDTRLTTAENDALTTPDVISIFRNRTLDELYNVQTVIPSNGDTLVYNSSTNKWEPVAPSDNTVIELNDATDVAAISNTTIKNAIVRVNTNTSISNVVFENCTIGIDNTGNFSGCTFTGCSVRESDNASFPWNVSFSNSCNLWGVEIYGFNNCAIDSSSVSGLTISHGGAVNIDSCTTTLTRLNITSRSLTIDNQAAFSYSVINILDFLKIDSGTADNQVSFQDSTINIPHIYSDVAYSILVDSDSRINVEDSYTSSVFGTGYHLKIVNDQGDTLIDKNVGNSALLHSPFKIREGQLVVSTSGNIEMLIADALNVSSTSANTEYEVISPAPDYNPNSLIVNTNQFEAPSTGIYIINVSCLFSGNASTGSSIYIYKNSNLVKFATKSEPRQLSTGDKVLSLVAGDLINITISTSDGSAHSITTDYTIKKIS